MKIALVGYGKMGKTLEIAGMERGHEFPVKITSSSSQEEWDKLKECDVAIEFTRPDAAVSNISRCFELGVPVVVGTTGWMNYMGEIKRICEDLNGTLLYASNFSLGVNLFFEINRLLARLMDGRSEYTVSMKETHHTEKIDAPSGTAINLANDIIANNTLINRWAEGVESHKDILGIKAERLPNVPGTHAIVYESEIDRISIEHLAHSRKGFAVGAIVAAEYIHDKKGVYTMKDVLKIDA